MWPMTSIELGRSRSRPETVEPFLVSRQQDKLHKWDRYCVPQNVFFVKVRKKGKVHKVTSWLGLYFSNMRSRPRWTDFQKNGMVVGVYDVIINSNFDFHTLRGFGYTGGGGTKLPFFDWLYSYWSSLPECCRYRAACDKMQTAPTYRTVDVPLSTLRIKSRDVDSHVSGMPQAGSHAQATLLQLRTIASP